MTAQPAICEYNCTNPKGHIDEDGTFIHDEGPARNSFICHFDPDDLPPGQSKCDCWGCETGDPDAGDHIIHMSVASDLEAAMVLDATQSVLDQRITNEMESQMTPEPLDGEGKVLATPEGVIETTPLVDEMQCMFCGEERPCHLGDDSLAGEPRCIPCLEAHPWPSGDCRSDCEICHPGN